MTLPSITMTGAALPGAANDSPPWPVLVAKSVLGYGVIPAHSIWCRWPRR
jgi:hypothetical protein